MLSDILAMTCLSCNNSHHVDTRIAYACNDAMNISCNSQLYASCDVNDLFLFDNIVHIYLWIIDSGCSKHMMGNRALLINFVEKFLRTVRFDNNGFAVIAGYGDIRKSSKTNVETSNNKIPLHEGEVFHEVSKSFQEESSSSSLNDDVQQSSKKVIVPSSNTQSISNNIVPNVNEASSSHNVFNERLEDAYFDAIARIEAIRLFLVYAFTVFQMDVKTVSLNGILKEEVYVGQPSGFFSKTYPDHVYALDKVLYGLKQAPRACCCAQVLWMRTQLTDYDFFYNKVPIYCDSKSAIAISCNPVHHTRTKYIDVRCHFIKGHVEEGIIELYFVGTEYQLADLFTKSLPEARFKFLVEKLGMMSRET
nr:retrovirus-related Pol polyprotein from transposon TNT 1-94 [Tanacetum cinerariifolium]